MAKTLVYQIYLFGFMERERSKNPSRFYKQSAISSATQHLVRVKELGADVVWLGPIFHSPWCDHGYDIADHYRIEPFFGSTEDFDAFVTKAHQLGLKVVIDLVLNHTSIGHKWFRTYPSYYCWSSEDRPGWRNLFSNGPAWEYDKSYGAYYLHSFHSHQADLNWFPNDYLNQNLVREFQNIVYFWTSKHHVDGFRLDVPQSINKDFARDTLEFEDLLLGHRAVEVINAIFQDQPNLFLMMECFDPTMGELVKYYANSTPVDFILNVLVKDEVAYGELRFIGLIERQAKNPRFMLDLESHDSPRFPSRELLVENCNHSKEVTSADSIWYLFNSGAEGICLYQGQELGLKNPTKEQLPDQDLLRLDAQTTMRFIMGEDLDSLRPTSRANARARLPIEEYEHQEQNPSSYLNLTKRWIDRWRS